MPCTRTIGPGAAASCSAMTAIASRFGLNSCSGMVIRLPPTLTPVSMNSVIEKRGSHLGDRPIKLLGRHHVVAVERGLVGGRAVVVGHLAEIAVEHPVVRLLR